MEQRPGTEETGGRRVERREWSQDTEHSVFLPQPNTSQALEWEGPWLSPMENDHK